MTARSMRKDNSGMGELAARAEPARHVLPRCGGGFLEQSARRLRRLGHQVFVQDEIREAQERVAALTLAHDLARAAQFEIELGNLEAVRVLIDRLQPLPRVVRQGFAEE